ncbi:SET domain-containing protein-lysine N-methyltransferase [Candidatus Micrarchaeota archaeon]|nr:SET domain-containing protein-lysine N-methyltransferase [Candidatus Micrarchaeota archaeon]
MKVAVRRSPRHNLGVFALRKFKSGEFIIDITGRVIKKSEMRYIPQNDRDHLDNIGKGTYIIMGCPERYINHSCEPNVFVRHRKVYAMRGIAAGEELVGDYSINGVDNWKMRCRCGSQSCRGIVHGSFFRLPVELQIEYSPYLDDWFRNAYRNRISRLV